MDPGVNVYGAGPPRSGTSMLAQCLSIVRETHHECTVTPGAGAPMHLAAWKGGSPDISVVGHHGSEVAYFYTFVSGRLGGKLIHLWRPPGDWVRSAIAFGMFDRDRLWKLRLDPPEGSVVEQALWLWREYHGALLATRPDAYVITPDRIVWTDLLDWLGWDYTPEQICEMQVLQRQKPNRKRGERMPPPDEVPLDEASTALAAHLDTLTKFSRHEARHPV